MQRIPSNTFKISDTPKGISGITDVIYFDKHRTQQKRVMVFDIMIGYQDDRINRFFCITRCIATINLDNLSHMHLTYLSDMDPHKESKYNLDTHLALIGEQMIKHNIMTCVQRVVNKYEG